MFDVETKIKLNKFKLRFYQEETWDAIMKDGFKKVILVAARRCLDGDSHITMSDGSFKFLKDIKKGDKILSWNGEKFESDLVENVWQSDEKATLKIKSPKFPSIVTSGDHQFARFHNTIDRDIAFKKIVEIKEHYHLLHYGGYFPQETVHNPELAEFWGYLLADGYVSRYQQPKFTNTNLEILKRVEYLAEKLFNVAVIWRKKGNGYDLGLSNKTKGGGKTHNPIKDLFRLEGCDIPKYKRRLPRSIFSFDSESIYSFLGAVISCDGSLYCHKNGFVPKNDDVNVPPSLEISIHCGKSKLYSWDIYWLLRKLGIIARPPKLEKLSNWKIKISISEFITQLLSNCTIVGKKDAQDKMLVLSSLRFRKQLKNKSCYYSKFKKSEYTVKNLYDIQTQKNHNFIANGYIVHNSGKDMLGWNLAVRQCLMKPCLVYYVLPTYSQARKAIFDCINMDGIKLIDYIPEELIAAINQSEMKITFINNSILQCIGGDSYNTSLIGTNPYAVILSEYSRMVDCYPYIRPILAANGGWVLFVSTPFGKNHFYSLVEFAKELPDWKVIIQPASVIKHISDDVLLQEKHQMSEELYAQEYECSFTRGCDGSYYAKLIEKARQEGRICPVAWEPSLMVHTAWDLGVSDSCCIIWYQTNAECTSVRIIDFYMNNNFGVDHYAKIIQSKPYRYGYHFCPADIAVREFGAGAVTRFEKAAQLGIDFTVVDQISRIDGIDNVLANFNKFWIDNTKCKRLIDALENYYREWDEERQIYKSTPVHNWASHAADALRYLCLSIHKTKRGMTSQDFDRAKAEALYGNRSNLPRFFQDDPSYDRFGR